MFPTKPYEISPLRINNFPKRGMTVPESQTTPTANNSDHGCSETKHQNDDKSIELSDVMANTPADESASTTGGDPVSAARDLIQ
jgi:hypothetical protein